MPHVATRSQLRCQRAHRDIIYLSNVPFLSRAASEGNRSVEVIVPGNGAGSDGGRGDGGEVQSCRGSFPGSTRARGSGALYDKNTISIDILDPMYICNSIGVVPVHRGGWWLIPSAKHENGERGSPEIQQDRHTLDTLFTPFRSPLRVRVERKQDLASIIGKLYRSRGRSRYQDVTAMVESISRVGGSKRLSRRGHTHRENPAFRNGPTLIGSSHVQL